MKKAFKKICTTAQAKNFARNDQGAVALIVGVALVAIIIGVLSYSIDLNRTQTSYNKMQNSTDAAASGASEYILKHLINQIGKVAEPFNNPPSNADITSYAKNILVQNFTRDQSSGVFDPSSLEVNYTGAATTTGLRNYTVTVKACADLDTRVAKAANHANQTRVCTTSKAAFSLRSLDNLEVAFALDFTNSMFWKGDGFPAECDPGTPNSPANNTSEANCPAYNNTKAKSLVDAMNFVLDNYLSTGSTVYASIVPYSAMVNIWPYSNTMVNAVNTPATPAIPEKYRNFYNMTGDSYALPTPTTHFYVNYGGDMSYVLNRIPIINSEAQFNNIVNVDGNPEQFSTYPFNSYYNHFTSLASTDDVRYLCYTAGVIGGLDQRIEKYIAGGTSKGIVVTPSGLDYKIKTTTSPSGSSTALIPNASACTGGTCGSAVSLPHINRYTATGVQNTHELHESFPIQPLTNNVNILKGVINRFGAKTRLYDDAHNSVPGVGAFVDRQSNILNKAMDFSYQTGTSSIHGLMWTWFTINNHWKDRWNAKSLHELYYPDGDASQGSRAGLPSEEHFKHIIFLTDGHDNDGTTGSVCDAYLPTSTFPESRYQNLCTRIKNDNIKIHTILLGVNDTASSRYRNCSTSDDTFHGNVQPEQLQAIMDGIFKKIITDLVTVRLVN